MWRALEGSSWSYGDRAAYIVMELLTKSKTQMELAREFRCREQRISQVFIETLGKHKLTAETDPAMVALALRRWRHDPTIDLNTPARFYWLERFLPTEYF